MLPAGELVHRPCGQGGQVERRQSPIHAAVVIAVGVAALGHNRAHGEAEFEAGLLGDPGRAPPAFEGAERGYRPVAPENRAGGGDEAGGDVEQGRFARSVRTDQAHHRPRRQTQGDILDSSGHGGAGDFEGVHGWRLSRP